MTNANNKNCKRAFTLIEVVVALAIFATSLMLLSQSFVNALMCKQMFLQEDDSSTILQCLREQIIAAKSQEDAAKGGQFISPINNEEIKWSASPQKTKVYALFEVKVLYASNSSEDKNETTFLIQKEDWLPKQERAEFVKKCKAYQLAKKQESLENE